MASAAHNRNSARTRVGPFFDFLIRGDPAGESWLPTLLSLPNLQVAPRGRTGPLLCRGWYPNERRLAPPLSLLRYLIEHPSGARPRNLGTSSDRKRRKRELLMGGDEATRREALDLLTRGGDDWHIFEGPTSVDVYLETASIIALIEGKRTEPGPTTKTSWMPARHQMLRNLDAAWDVRGNKEVVGFFIVDEDDSPVPPAVYVERTTDPKAIRESLPHRTDPERQRIAKSFKGVTTWQEASRRLRVPWSVFR